MQWKRMRSAPLGLLVAFALLLAFGSRTVLADPGDPISNGAVVTADNVDTDITNNLSNASGTESVALPVYGNTAYVFSDNDDTNLINNLSTIGLTEPTTDSDGDGTPDVSDPDDDNDGINDVDEPGDSDGDGIPDRLESNVIDSDGDGAFDFNDSNADGDAEGNDGTGGEQDGVLTGPWNDADGDGIPAHLDPNDATPGAGDADGDGINDDVECVGGYICPDSDGDGVPDYADTDSDNDGVSDQDENSILGTDPTDADSDSSNTPGADENDNGTNDANEDLDNDGFTNADELAAGTDPLDPNSVPGVVISAKVLLQGALINPANPAVPLSVMRDELRSREAADGFNGKFLPVISPYGGGENVLIEAPVSGAGASAFNVSLFADNGNDSVVDWVQLELRNSTTPSTIVATLAALVQRDGDVMDVSGSTTLVFRGVGVGSYFVAVTHRNHLGAMTAAPASLSGTATVVDFTSTAADFFNAATNLNGVEQATVGGKFALWTGDANGDGRITFSGQNNDVDAIFTAIDQAPGNLLGLPSFVLNGYLSTDVDLTGSTIFTGEDVNTIFNTVDGHPRNLFGLPTYVIVEQLP